jgi:TPR repeat protein
MFACGCREKRKSSSTDEHFGRADLERTRGNLATLCAYGQAVLRDLRRTAKLLRNGCHFGKGAGRTESAALPSLKDGLDRDGQPLALLEQACHAGNSRRCEQLATMAESGISGTKDPVKAVTYHWLACYSRNAHSCTSFAQALLEGRGVARNVDRARHLFDSSCGRGDGRACFDLGILYDTPRAGAKDEARAAALFQRGCEDGEMGACSRYGLMLALGRGAPRDEYQALTLLKRACHAGDADGCEGLEGTALGHPQRLTIRESD